MADVLRDTCDRLLLDHLSPALKRSIDRLLARGLSKRAVLELIGDMVRKAANGDPNKGTITMAAVEAYLDAPGLLPGV